MTVLNADRLQKKLLTLPNTLRRPIEQALLVSATEMHNDAVVNIQRNSGGGRTYKRGSRVHVASEPGEYPNTDTGELVRKMFAEMRGALTAAWGNRAKHAIWLEFGTSRMAPRPFVRPTFRKFISKATERVAKAVREALRGR